MRGSVVGTRQGTGRLLDRSLAGKPTRASFVIRLPRIAIGEHYFQTSARGVAVVVVATVLWLFASAADSTFLTSQPSQTAAVGAGLASALLLVFAALLVLVIPEQAGRARRQWIGAGVFALGVGKLALGVVYPVLHGDLDANIACMVGIAFWTLGAIEIALGLFPLTPPKPLLPAMLVLTLTVIAVFVPMTWLTLQAPGTISSTDLQSSLFDARFTGMVTTRLYLLIALPPIVSMFATAIAAAVRWPRVSSGGWLAVAIALLAGAQLHDAFWLSSLTPVITNASILWLAAATLLVAGGWFELRRFTAGYGDLGGAAEPEDGAHRSTVDALRADFRSLVSHEIGASLAAIGAYADILDLPQLDSAARSKAVSTIHGQVDHLRTLVDDVAMIEKDRFDVRPLQVPLNAILAEGAAFAASLPGDHPFSCTLQLRERVVVDPIRIAQVLRNLLSNAAKYSRPEDPIELRAERMGEHVRIEVVDRGYGIPAKEIDRIFDKHYRSNAECIQAVAGSGLGLYISRRIVEAHGSRLTVSSVPGVGSVFGFEVEVAR